MKPTRDDKITELAPVEITDEDLEIFERACRGLAQILRRPAITSELKRKERMAERVNRARERR